MKRLLLFLTIAALGYGLGTSARAQKKRMGADRRNAVGDCFVARDCGANGKQTLYCRWNSEHMRECYPTAAECQADKLK